LSDGIANAATVGKRPAPRGVLICQSPGRGPPMAAEPAVLRKFEWRRQPRRI